MTVTSILVVLVALQAKHLVCDFLLQTPFMHTNKGKYGHPGGLLHAGLHGAGTFLVLLGFATGLWAALAVSLAEALFHYHVDWTKEQIGDRYRLTVSTAGYWAIFGLDQAVHQWTYVVIAGLTGSL